MTKVISLVAICLSLSVVTMAQTTATDANASGTSQTTAAAGKVIELQSGTALAAELQNTIDVRKAKVGDQIIFKTTKAIKSEGRTVVEKGARLIGHVSEVQQRSKENGVSRIGLLFDKLENGSLSIPISATISSITSGRATARSNEDALFESSSGASSQTSAQGSGGLLSGVGSTVGGVASTAGSVVGSSTAAVGSTVNNTTTSATALTRSLGRIQIAESSSTSAEGGSTLSLSGDNLKLEKGTNFNLVLTQSASASTEKQP